MRPLLPVGYRTVSESYALAANEIAAADLSEHYTTGLDWFHDAFVPELKSRLRWLSGGEWQPADLNDFIAFAAGSDADMITHLVEAISAREPVALFPGDWFGFSVGTTHSENVHWSVDATGRLACLCVPSVRNGHLTEEMLEFLESGSTCLLNLNLFPTLAPNERSSVARSLRPLLEKSVLSISFSRGFGMTASQLGVFLVHRDHPFARRFHTQWSWHTYFFNALASRAFIRVNLNELQAVDDARRKWVEQWLRARGLPSVATGSYYVKSFILREAVPAALEPLTRNGVVRLCLKPPIFSLS